MSSGEKAEEDTTAREPGADDGDPSFCSVHPGQAAAGICTLCGEARCAICFEDGGDGACRDCVPTPAPLARIRPSLRLVRRRRRPSPGRGPLWLCVTFVAYYAVAAGSLFVVSWADGCFGWRLGLAGWASLHPGDLALAALVLATALSFVRPRPPAAGKGA